MLIITTIKYILYIVVFIRIAVRSQGETKLHACEGKLLAIYCPKDQFIVIIEAFYGRKDTSICNCSDVCSNTKCTSSPYATSIVVSRCEGRQSCFVGSNNYVFGDPCEGTHKYLQATYRCVQNSPTQPHSIIKNVCEGDQLAINCPIDQFIVILKALYGRRGIAICPCSDSCSNRYCTKSPNSVSILVLQCEGKQSCIVGSNNDVFGDPCPRTYKYLRVKYVCVQNSPTEPVNITKNVCDGNQLAINCPAGQIIVIKDSFYGRDNTSICPCSDFCYNTNCASSPNSLSILVSQCQGKQTCTVNSNEDVFGYSCPYTSKYLQATYECVLNCPYGTYPSHNSCNDCGLVVLSKFRPQVVNGYNATSQTFPSVVRLIYNNGTADNFVCTGTLISEKTVLTAAHCFFNDRNSDRFKVVYGVTNFDTDYFDTSVIPVAKVIWHEHYNDNDLHNDIGLLILKDRITVSSKALVGCLPCFDGSCPNLYNAPATVVGWGKINETTNKFPSILQFAPQYIYDPSEYCNFTCLDQAKKNIERNFSTQLCIGYNNSVGICGGDSGGPLFITEYINDWKQVIIGVTSYKCGLCGEFPSISTNVVPYLNWIKRYMEY